MYHLLLYTNVGILVEHLTYLLHGALYESLYDIFSMFKALQHLCLKAMTQFTISLPNTNSLTHAA